MKGKLEGFSDEWVTFGRHRVLLSVRDGFPGPYEREVVSTLALLLENEDVEAYERAQITHLFHDDTNGYTHVFVATDVEEDVALIQENASALCELVWRSLAVQTVVDFRPKGRVHSDHYDHAEYMARQVGLVS